MKNFKQTEDSKCIHQKELDKACFQHDMAYEDLKDLLRRKVADKLFCETTFNIAKNPKYDGYQREPASLVYTFFDKKSAQLVDKSTSGSGVKTEIMSIQELAEKLQKPIIRKFKN